MESKNNDNPLNDEGKMTMEQQNEFIETMKLQLSEFEKIDEFYKNNINITRKKFKKIFPEMMQKYPKLCEGILSGIIKPKQLILNKRTWLDIYMQTDGTHREKKFQADKNIGTKLAKQYLRTPK